MSGKFFLGCLVVTSLALGACGEDDDGTTTPTPDAGNVDPCQGLTYDNYAKDLLTKNCAACHGATPVLGTTLSLDTQAKVADEAEHIILHAVERQEPAMPQAPLPPLPEADREKLRTWLECGAP